MILKGGAGPDLVVDLSWLRDVVIHSTNNYFDYSELIKSIVGNQDSNQHLSIFDDGWIDGEKCQHGWGNHTQLYLLNLSRNSLVSSIPDSITRLHYLGVLDLHSNQLTGPINKVFDIEKNACLDGSDGRVPKTLGNLRAMQTLDFSCNKLGFNLPETLANASSLEKLKLRRNHFADRIPVGILNLGKRKEMDLSDNRLLGEIPARTPFNNFPERSYSGNKDLCGKPLSPCKA
ncbi:LRR receptor-like serine/threonine-protein kinase ERECTA [Tripterygium wilfordii]|uniref:LRR receptor-like serine/threonine-protein kinase ERECTA n=1 Tax=Tripterygium wilfordii TaxID=458696 RepID=UPI0018F840F8|nr:LRR receptor-like serine/threonine-protein kinase ERECTA [Tripterygium wilfordii]